MQNINDDSGSEKTVIIYSGSTTGVGRCALNYLVKENNLKLILPVRNLEVGANVVSELKLINDTNEYIVMKMDLSSFESIKSFVEEFNGLQIGYVDILVNVAGILAPVYKKTIDSYESSIGVNHYGTSLLTFQLLPLLNKSKYNGVGGNIVIVSSKLYLSSPELNFNSQPPFECEPPKFDTNIQYKKSKLCNLLFSLELQKQLQESNSTITVNALHPGYYPTTIIKGQSFFRRILYYLFLGVVYRDNFQEMGENLATLSLNKKQSAGKYYEISKETEPQINDPNLSKSLWDKTCEILNISNKLFV